MTEEDQKEYNLDVDSELRFEIETKNKSCTITLNSGMAELFGTELVKGKAYEFTDGAKVAIFSYHGCKIQLKGYTDVCYIAKETPMVRKYFVQVDVEIKLRIMFRRSNT